MDQHVAEAAASHRAWHTRPPESVHAPEVHNEYSYEGERVFYRGSGRRISLAVTRLAPRGEASVALRLQRLVDGEWRPATIGCVRGWRPDELAALEKAIARVRQLENDRKEGTKE